MSTNAVPVYMICLPGSERSPLTLSALAAQGIFPECIEAIEASHLGDEKRRQMLEAEFTQLRDIDESLIMQSTGADTHAQAASLACCLSHLRCLRAIKTRGHQCALVLEDDAQLHPQIRKWLGQLQSCCRLWDVLRLHQTQKSVVYGPELATLGDRRRSSPGLSIRQYLGGHTGAVALLYSRPGVIKVLDMHRRFNWDFRYCFDTIFAKWYLVGLRYCYLRPALAQQNTSLESTIYPGVSNLQYERNILGWFSVRGRLSRAYRRITRVYLPAPHRLAVDAWNLLRALFAFAVLYANYRRQWRAQRLSQK